MKPLQLPIHAVIPNLLASLASNDELILEAPPGAGKTTVVPLALLDQDWLADKKILLLEPRRLAARNAAQRMADSLGEKLGETVGYRIRLDSKISSKTRIEVITEGILTRLLQDDPSLDDYAVVIFDEFHERSLHADLGLSLSLHGRSLFEDLREQPLKLLLMSATLNSDTVRRVLPKAALVQSEGRAFPVDIRYRGAFNYQQDTVAEAVACAIESFDAGEGSQLIFLPGQAEIQRATSQLKERFTDQISKQNLLICPLYGALTMQQQRQAVEAVGAGQTKIVLATNIAETSITIQGITVVIDAGLCRSAEFDLATGLSKLNTHRISKASAAQRAGRAGRTSAGICYRLWSKEQQFSLAEYDQPEILNADLAPIVLQLLHMGVAEQDELLWLDRPKPAAFSQAYDLLQQLNITEQSATGHWRLTELGQQVAELPVHPRLGVILVFGLMWSCERLACQIVALLSERDLLLDQRDMSADLHLRLLALNGDYQLAHHQKAKAAQIRQHSKQLNGQLLQLASSVPQNAMVADEESLLGLLLCAGFPDRLAKQRQTHKYYLSNGRTAQLAANDGLTQHAYLVAPNVGGKQQSTDTIFAAASVDITLIQQYLPDLVSQLIEADWDSKTGRFIAEQRRKVGAVVIAAQALDLAAPENKALKYQALKNLVQKKQWQLFDTSAQYQQWLGRLKLVAKYSDLDLPPINDESLLGLLLQGIETRLDEIKSIEDFKKLKLVELIQPQLDWQLVTVMKQSVPEKYALPNGKFANIDYTVSPPVVAAKLQWFFGCAVTPSVCEAKQPLMVHLLSPAQRPLQVTQDLAGFWTGSYHAVKKDMKGRYPKHAWPDNPEQFIDQTK